MQPINRRISEPITKILSRWGITPNQVTFLGLSAGLLAAGLFAQGTYAGWMWGALFFQISYILDNCDGELARMTGKTSGLGSWLDVISDALVHCAFFWGLAVGLERFGPGAGWIRLGWMAAGAIVFSYVAYVIEQVQWRGREALEHPDPPHGEEPKSFWRRAVQFFRFDFSLIVLVSAVLGQLSWILVGGAIGTSLVLLANVAGILSRAFQKGISPASRVGNGSFRRPKGGEISFLKRDFSSAKERWRTRNDDKLTHYRRVRSLGFLVGLALLFWVIKESDVTAVWRQIRGLQWRFGLILLFYIVIFGLDTLGWQFALRRGSGIRWDHLFWTRLAGEAVNYVTPTAWVGGEPVKAYLLSKRYGIPLEEGMASVVIAKTTFSISMFLFILTGILVTLLTQQLDPSVFRWVWIALPILGVLLALFLLVQFLKPFERSAALVKRVIPGWLRSLGSKVGEWDTAITRFYRQSPKSVLLSLAFHFLGWVAGVIEVYLIFHFLQIPVSLPMAWSIEALWVLLKAGAFLIPASLGASEGIVLFICVGLGINAVSGLALALVRRARELLWVGLGLVEFSRQSSHA